MSTHLETKKAQDDLTSYFDRSAAAVRTYSDRFEQKYARPAIDRGFEYFEAHPIPFTFIAVFSSFSFLPVVAFIGFSLFVITSVVAVAIFSVLMTVLAVEIVLFTTLLSVLVGIAFLSLFLTAGVISVFIAARLVLHVRQQGRVGVQEWAHETKSHFLASKLPDAPNDSESESSAVIVKEQSKHEE
ncbi:hypothetical protein PLICRDRAFT_105714 [Plicaturopsis crispa FD-325 SS-3]|nr:hypothetical protein PLICRDRAFT_105714 [Plicaturopsis crispa FD-325 SS-3]